MQQQAQALKVVIVGIVGIAAAALLTLSMVQFVAQRAEATPALGQGKPCNACHTSSTPSKNDLKK